MNGDLISRSALLEKTIGVVVYDEGGWDCNVRAVPDYVVEKAPAVDAVEVVRCKDCKHRTEYFDSGMYVCKHEQCPVCGKAAFVADDHFCGYGERRADDAD